MSISLSKEAQRAEQDVDFARRIMKMSLKDSLFTFEIGDNVRYETVQVGKYTVVETICDVIISSSLSEGTISVMIRVFDFRIFMMIEKEWIMFTAQEFFKYFSAYLFSLLRYLKEKTSVS